MTTGDNSDGGGVFTATGVVTLTESTLSGNQTTGDGSAGGGILVNTGTLNLLSSAVVGNQTEGVSSWGGGIRTYTGDVNLQNSTVSGNSTEGDGSNGGGIHSYAGDISVVNSTISGNSAIDADGGGLWFNRSTVSIINSTITGNSASGEGGGLSIFRGDNDEVLTIRNSIIAGNSDNGTAPDFEAPDNPSINLVVSNSLIGDNTSTTLVAAAVGSPDANGNLVGTTSSLIDPLLGPLQDNGGPTQTHALLAGSPAIDAGDNALAVDANGDPLINDQRGSGFDRIFDGTVDIGALESGAPTFLPGDVDQNGMVNFLDINPFIEVLASNSFQAEADANQDGVVNFLDINPFIGLLSSQRSLTTAQFFAAAKTPPCLLYTSPSPRDS